MQPVPRGAPALRALSRGSGAAELPAESTGPIGAVQRIPSCRAVPCRAIPTHAHILSRPVPAAAAGVQSAICLAGPMARCR